MKKTILTVALLLAAFAPAALAQRYNGIIDKTVAVVGGEFISLSEIEQEVQMMRAQGMGSDRNSRCTILENMLQAKLFLMQARVDSLKVNNDMVQAELSQRIDQMRTALGGDEQAEQYFGKPLFKLRQEWQAQLEENSLIQQEQQNIAKELEHKGSALLCNYTLFLTPCASVSVAKIQHFSE